MDPKQLKIVLENVRNRSLSVDDALNLITIALNESCDRRVSSRPLDVSSLLRTRDCSVHQVVVDPNTPH